MPSPLYGNLTIKKLLRLTHEYKPNRFEYAKRDVAKSRILVKKIHVYDQKKPGEARTTYLIESKSWPQYKPYYTGFDRRGRKIKYQRTISHKYDVTIQLDRLSINVPVKLRTGAIAKWDFSKKARPKKLLSGKIKDSENAQRGINGDFFFCLEDIYYRWGILYGRRYTNGRAKIKNPNGVPFLDKHMITVIKTLMERGILKD